MSGFIIHNQDAIYGTSEIREAVMADAREWLESRGQGTGGLSMSDLTELVDALWLNARAWDEMVSTWGTPDWAVPGVVAWLRSGGDLDQDLWLAIQAAAAQEARA